jgi:hypothetical protein
VFSFILVVYTAGVLAFQQALGIKLAFWAGLWPSILHSMARKVSLYFFLVWYSERSIVLLEDETV